MKQRLLLGALMILIFPFLIACSGGGGGGLFEPDPGLNPYGFRFDPFTPANTPTMSNRDLRALATNADRSKIFVGSGNGLFTFSPADAAPNFSAVVDAALTNNPINELMFDSSGDLLIGTDNGLYRQTLGAGALNALPQFVGKKVLSLTEQSSGTIWVGMEDLTASTTSVARIQAGVVEFWGSSGNRGMPASAVVDIYADSTGLVIACCRGDVTRDGLFKFDGQIFSRYNASNLASGATFFNKVDSTWYASGYGAGLISSVDSGITWAATNLKDAVVTDMVRYVAPGNLFRTWLATDKGLYVTYDFSTFQLYNSGQGLVQDATPQVLDVDQVAWTVHSGVGTGGLTRVVFTGN